MFVYDITEFRVNDHRFRYLESIDASHRNIELTKKDIKTSLFPLAMSKIRGRTGLSRVFLLTGFPSYTSLANLFKEKP